MIYLSDYLSWLNARVAFLEMSIASPCSYTDKGELWDKRQQAIDSLENVDHFIKVWDDKVLIRGLGCPHSSDKVED